MPSYSGSGKTLEDPIVISDVESHFEAIAAEYEFLDQKYGRRGVDWRLVRQSLLGQDGKQIDQMEIEVTGHGELTYYFDITEYFGKF
ncbi:MAG: hypothetical protein EAX95_12615 [Candidatus Thorarchaeota archaeon]|nr:hypothetical protein [Candidatus Thorarchaeota archaeon]